MEERIVDVRSLVINGRLFRPPEDASRVEAFIPPAGLENHAATLAQLLDGTILCAWFSGTAEGMGDVRIVLSRLSPGSGAWSEPQVVSEGSGVSEQNPVLFATPAGQVWLLYTAQQTRGGTRAEWERRVASGEVQGGFTMQWTAIIRRRISEDGGHTWGAVEDYFTRPGSFCRQPMVVLSNGDWLFPMYYSLEAEGHGKDYSVVQISADQGRTWQEFAVPDSHGRVHMCVVELSEGNLLALFRSRAADRIYLSRSSNYGRTWSIPERTSLPNNNASIQATRLASGSVALAFNHYSAGEDPNATLWPRRRYPLTVALSEDGGETWPYIRHVHPGDGFCGEANAALNRRYDYPCLLQSRDGAIHLAYSFADRQCIKHVCLSEAWIRSARDHLYAAGP